MWYACQECSINTNICSYNTFKQEMPICTQYLHYCKCEYPVSIVSWQTWKSMNISFKTVNHLTTLFSYILFFVLCKDEKNQIITTNAWLQMVSIMNNINNLILICSAGWVSVSWYWVKSEDIWTSLQISSRFCLKHGPVMRVDQDIYVYQINSVLFIQPKLTSHNFASKVFTICTAYDILYP